MHRFAQSAITAEHNNLAHMLSARAAPTELWYPLSTIPQNSSNRTSAPDVRTPQASAARSCRGRLRQNHLWRTTALNGSPCHPTKTSCKESRPSNSFRLKGSMSSARSPRAVRRLMKSRWLLHWRERGYTMRMTCCVKSRRGLAAAKSNRGPARCASTTSLGISWFRAAGGEAVRTELTKDACRFG